MWWLGSILFNVLSYQCHGVYFSEIPAPQGWKRGSFSCSKSWCYSPPAQVSGQLVLSPSTHVCTNLSWNAPGVPNSPCKQLWQKQQLYLKNNWVWSCWETCQSECFLRKHPAGVPSSPHPAGVHWDQYLPRTNTSSCQRWAQTCVRDERASVPCMGCYTHSLVLIKALVMHKWWQPVRKWPKLSLSSVKTMQSKSQPFLLPEKNFL